MTSAACVTRGALLGLFGGLVAAGAMSIAHRMANDIAPKAETPTAETDPTVKVASAITRSAGYDLSEDQKLWRHDGARSPVVASPHLKIRSSGSLRRS